MREMEIVKEYKPEERGKHGNIIYQTQITD